MPLRSITLAQAILTLGNEDIDFDSATSRGDSEYSPFDGRACRVTSTQDRATLKWYLRMSVPLLAVSMRVLHSRCRPVGQHDISRVRELQAA
jgi:hypothetical protein